jgi:hypothetical protein
MKGRQGAASIVPLEFLHLSGPPFILNPSPVLSSPSLVILCPPPVILSVHSLSAALNRQKLGL